MDCRAGSTITQLSSTIIAPTHRRTVIKDGAGGGTYGRERYCSATRTEAAGERGVVFGRRSSITQLAVTSRSPARHSTVVEDGAGVVSSRRDRYCCATCTEAAGECGGGFGRSSSMTQLAVTSSSPARHRTVVEDGASMVTCGRDLVVRISKGRGARRTTA